jgi:hypothetical protein
VWCSRKLGYLCNKSVQPVGFHGERLGSPSNSCSRLSARFNDCPQEGTTPSRFLIPYISCSVVPSLPSGGFMPRSSSTHQLGGHPDPAELMFGDAPVARGTQIRVGSGIVVASERAGGWRIDSSQERETEPFHQTDGARAAPLPCWMVNDHLGWTTTAIAGADVRYCASEQ